MAIRCWLASGLFSAFLFLPSGVAASAERPGIGSIVPEDVHFYLGHQVTEARQKLEEPYEEAFLRLIRSGIGRDILDLATMDLPEEMRKSVRETARQVVHLLRTPRWRDLVDRRRPCIDARANPGDRRGQHDLRQRGRHSRRRNLGLPSSGNSGR